MFYGQNFAQNSDIMFKISENTRKVLIVLAVHVNVFELKTCIFSCMRYINIKNSNKVAIYAKFDAEFRYDT